MSIALPTKTSVVLVVEDEPVLRASVVRGLFKLGSIEVMDAGTVREAVALIASQTPDLVISDLDLPDGSGIEVVAELDRRGIRIPIVFVSAYVRSFQARLPRRAGIEVHEKPVALERLRRIVIDHIGGAEKKESPPSPFGVADYIQLAALGQRSLVMDVRAHTGGGRIVIVGGEVWAAADTEGEGVTAFRRLVFAPGASVECERFDPHAEIARNVHGSAESLLLDAARLFDEAGGSYDQAVDSGWDAEAITSTRSATLGTSGTAKAGTAKAATAETFASAYDTAVEALLAKKYAEAFLAFEQADRLGPGDTRVAANLQRLRQLGFGR